jgi:hypothetical protein
LTSLNDSWVGEYIDEGLRIWTNKKDVDNLKVIPIIMGWGLWLARNVNLFKEKEVLALQHAN